MEHTEKCLTPNKGLITSLLKVFAIFELRLFDVRDKVEAIAIRCINCRKKQVYTEELQH